MPSLRQRQQQQQQHPWRPLPAVRQLLLLGPSLLLLLGAARVGAQLDLSSDGTEPCPTSDSNWLSAGVTGAIVETSSANVVYAYTAGSPATPSSYVGSASLCQQLCQSWPYLANAPVFPPFPLSSSNGASGSCAYWAWDGLTAKAGSHGVYTNTPTCFLFSAGACNPNNPVAFNANINTLTSRNYMSGGGPGSGSGGGVTGDPHYTGADNSHFDFTGIPGESYCILSDAHVHINFLHEGRYESWTEDPHKALVWVRKVGVLWGHHTVMLAARRGPRWQYDTGYMQRMEVDGQVVELGQAGDSMVLAGGDIEIRWVAAREKSADDEVDVYELRVSDVLLMKLTLRPEVAHLRSTEDGAVHFDIMMPSVHLSHTPHGVLGQTYRPDHQQRLQQQTLTYSELLQTHVVPGPNGEGFLDGSVADYRSSGILKADCPVSRFTRAQAVDRETAAAVERSMTSITSTMEMPYRMFRGVGTNTKPGTEED